MGKPATRYMIVSDTHGAMCDVQACKRAIEFANDYKPSIRVHLGDFVDFPTMRRGATDDDAEVSIADDLAAAAEFFTLYRPTVVLFGNHDQRLIRKAASLGAQVEQTDKLRKRVGVKAKDPASFGLETAVDRIEAMLRGVRTMPYSARDGVVGDVIPGWNLLHGYASGIHAVYKLASVYDNLICGHLHYGLRIPVPKWPRRVVGMCCPCLARLEMEWNRHQSGNLRQEHGYIFGEVGRGEPRIEAWA